ncbi:protein IQ-DOMAIN 1-like [Oryza brachyantha]|uniref:protein IQ-DOMAIN 1-like n=1 Tax=Oryza brachyantha TaxID=4533 RepID=UPI001ADAED8D|nr:protein IQ-DOMAIN 1-like [Oryza brachyantha]
MGASGKWIRSLVSIKAPSSEGTSRGRKWTRRLWRSSSSASAATAGGCGAADSEEVSEEASSEADAFSSVVAAVVRAPHRDFRVIRQEWAAVRVQAAFRAFLARRALKALRGIVRLQALVRGRLVRRQLAVTVKCMNALLRVQERARERRARTSADGRDSRDALGDRDGRADTMIPIKQAEEQWCDSQGSVAEVRSKIHMRHDAVAKRERAIAYALSHQPRSSKHSARPSSPARSLRSHDSNRCNHDWSYIEGWMATKPWESRLMEQDRSELTCFKNSGELNLGDSKVSNAKSVRIRRNNVTTRVAAKAPSVLSASSSEFLCDESSPSTSSATPARSDGGHGGGPSYMSLTKSAKARQSCNSPFQIQRQRSGGMSSYKRVALSPLDVQSNAGSEISVTSRKLNSLSLKGRSMTRSLDKENDNLF